MWYTNHLKKVEYTIRVSNLQSCANINKEEEEADNDTDDKDNNVDQHNIISNPVSIIDDTCTISKDKENHSISYNENNEQQHSNSNSCFPIIDDSSIIEEDSNTINSYSRN